MNQKLTYQGITDTIKGWGKRLGMSDVAIRQRIKRHGSDLDKVLAPKPPEQAIATATRRARRIAASGLSTLDDAARDLRDDVGRRAREIQPAKSAPEGSRTRPLRVVDGVLGDPAAILERLGYIVERLGTAPSGVIVLIRENAQ